MPGAGTQPGSLCLPVTAAQGDSGHRCDSDMDSATFEPSGCKSFFRCVNYLGQDGLA